MRRAVLIAAALVAATPAVANAAVKVQRPPDNISCGGPIYVGIRAPAGTKGSRVVRIKVVDGPSGKVWFHRRATAKRHWRHWFLPSGMNGQCQPTTIVYSGHNADGSAWTKRFKVVFHSEGV
jgi:hypothetical protein